MESTYDVAIVGGGIAGGELATRLAREGLGVLVLEKTTTYPDKVRGEWFSPWGVVELKRLGLYDLLVDAGGHHVTRHATFGDDIDDPQAALNGAMDLTQLVPGAPGPLCIRHTHACQVLTDAAAEAGATVLRGVSRLHVCPGPQPSVEFVHDGDAHTAHCRMIVGADGRAGVSRSQAGIGEHRDEPHHLFSGLLVDDAHGWPEDLQTKGTEGNINFLAFPQGNGRVRLYLGYSYEDKTLLSGAGAEERFLEAFRFETVPHSDALANATPISECHSYPNEDTWTDEPFVDGLVLVGDAAGHNDPIIGQGLSITTRDVRFVSEALLENASWSTDIFREYSEERYERMRRLRFAGRMQSVLDAEFGPGCVERRRRIRERSQEDPTLTMPVAASMVGPEVLPAEIYTEEHWARVFGE